VPIHACAGNEHMTPAIDSGRVFRFGEYSLDTSDERLSGPAGPVKLGNKAYGVLLMLLEQEGRLVTKDALFDTVWDGTIVSESALTSVIKELRRALGDLSRTPRYIESVYGRGYRLLTQVSVGEGRGSAPPAAAVSVSQASNPLGAAPLLYVAPFEDLEPGAKRHLAEVLREEVVLALSRFREIRLVTEMARPDLAGPAERGYQLSVRLLHTDEGSRAFARLSRLSSTAVIWGESLDLSHTSLAQNVEQLVRRVAAAALPRIQDDVFRNLPQRADDAYDLYFLNKLRMRSQDSLEEAREVAASWEALIREHPTLAHAYAPLIRLYNTDFCYTGLGATGPRERARAYELAHKAVALDPAEAHFHTVKGWCHIWAGEVVRAREHIEEALRLNPYNQNRLVEAATAFMFLDDLDRAAELLDRCRNLTPLSSDAPHEEDGLLLLLQRDYAAAAERLRLASRHHPDDGVVTSRTVISDLYALLAAAGADSPDLAHRAARWRSSVAQRWCSPESLTDDRLVAWIFYQQPFRESRRAWVRELMGKAFAASEEAPARDRAQARRERPSAPPVEG
jgi:DNA-binding winged helix-turn-helix (wHTH) protein/tetratricopeptide (TPR) repeat protein